MCECVCKRRWEVWGREKIFAVKKARSGGVDEKVKEKKKKGVVGRGGERTDLKKRVDEANV